MIFNILLFDDFTALDAFGPVEVLSGLPGSELRFVSLEGGLVSNHQNVSVMTEKFCDEMLGDVWLLPGGMGTRPLSKDEVFLEQLKRIAEASEFFLTVCTGSALLARTGLLDGRAATSNRRAAEWVRSCGPDANWQIEEKRWVRSGKYFTAAGVSAGIDMALAFVREIYGAESAREIASRMEYRWDEEL